MEVMSSFGGRLFSGRVQPRRLYGGGTSLLKLDSDGFTKNNYAAGVLNATLKKIMDMDKSVPTGVLGGSVGVVKGNGFVGNPTANLVPVLLEKPLGLFVNDAAGNPFESVSAAGSGIGVYYDGSGIYLEVAVYETNDRDVDGVHEEDLLAYAAGDYLFVDCLSGLLTNRKPKDSAGKVWPDPAFDPEDVANGVYPLPVAILIAGPSTTAWLSIKWIA